MATTTKVFITTLLLLALASSPVIASGSHFGVDDWSAKDLAKHITSDTNIYVSPDDLDHIGLNGNTLFSFASTDLSALGLKPAETIAVRRSLSELLHRMNTTPADFWEWRAANRRLFDHWISPLCFDPRALLIWMRFFDNNQAIGRQSARGRRFYSCLNCLEPDFTLKEIWGSVCRSPCSRSSV